MAYQAESSKVVEIPPNFYIGHLIGRKGKTIRDIQKLTGAKIIIPRKREETSSLPQKWFSFKVWPWSGFRKLDGAVVGRAKFSVLIQFCMRDRNVNYILQKIHF